MDKRCLIERHLETARIVTTAQRTTYRRIDKKKQPTNPQTVTRIDCPTNRLTDLQTYRLTDRQTDGLTDRRTNRPTDQPTDRQTN